MNIREDPLLDKDEPPCPGPNALQQTEREAMIDLLLLAMYADNHLSYSEGRVFNNSIEAMGWQSSTSLGMYINTATSRARLALRAPQKTEAFLDSITARLPTERSRHFALNLLIKLFTADGIALSETAFYKTVEAKLT